jgi:2-keto-3-deoxy-L-rhamnonate aldolase RhmA
MQEKLARGEVALCMATRLARTADIAMIADSCGFDAFYVDMEHCTISLDNTARICIAALSDRGHTARAYRQSPVRRCSASSRRGCARHHLPECEHAR